MLAEEIEQSLILEEDEETSSTADGSDADYGKDSSNDGTNNDVEWTVAGRYVNSAAECTDDNESDDNVVCYRMHQ
jgi:hypothetical protein